MRISDSAIRRPVTTAMVALGLILFGVIGVSRMKIDLFPNIQFPVIVVATFYPGAGPLEIESQVTDVLEEQLGTIPNLREITSRSTEGTSSITLQFEWGTDLDVASSDIRDKLDMAQALLPEGVTKPFVFKFDPSMIPVVNLVLSGSLSEVELRDIAEAVSQSLQRVLGVAMVGVAGGAQRQVQIKLDLRELAKAGITIEQFIGALKAQNLNFPIGKVSTKEERYLIRLVGEYDDLDEIRRTPIGSKGSSSLYVQDVADVFWGAEEVESYIRLNKKTCLFLWVQKRSDANTIAVARAVRREVERIRETLPLGVELEVFWDSSEVIERSVKNVANNLILGGVLAIFILFLFLRRFRPTMFVAFAIPISIFFAIFFMYLFGFTLNILSMAGLAIAVGMVVDNGIVVFEAIYRHREWGEEPVSAARIGTNEVSLAITASTLTTLAVFLPLLLLRGMMQVFFKELAWAIIFSLAASLGVALTLIPMLASRFLKIKTKGEEKGLFGKSETLYKKFEEIYLRILDWALNRRKLVILLIIVLFFTSLALFPFIGTEFVPEQEIRYTELFAEMPVGSNLEMTNRAISQLEEYLVEKWGEDLEGMAVQVGGGATIYAAAFGGARANSAEIDLIVKRGSKRSVQEIAQDLRKKATEIPGLVIRSGRTGGMGALMGVAPIQVDIKGYDLRIADSLAQLVFSRIETIPGIVDLKSSREKGDLEIQLVVDRQKASLYGLSPYQIGLALRTSIEGQSVTKYRWQGKEYDIVLRLKKEQRDEVAKILGVMVNSPIGSVPLKNLVEVEIGRGPLEIEHKNTERIVRITGNVFGQSAGRVGAKVLGAISDITPPPNFQIRVTGAYEEMVRSFRDLAFAVLIAVILVFMVMASQFESFRDPFIILFTIPLAIIGVFWILFITRTTLSLISGIGLLVLIGVVVNSGIVYIDYVNQLRRKREMELIEAVKFGGRIRMRPILMTALTTIFGLLPLALKIGEGSEYWAPLGRAVIGGMLFSTVLTLIFIPVLYTSFEKGAQKTRKKG